MKNCLRVEVKRLPPDPIGKIPFVDETNGIVLCHLGPGGCVRFFEAAEFDDADDRRCIKCMLFEQLHKVDDES